METFFENHRGFNLKFISDKAIHKTNALSRIAPYMNESKKYILMNSFSWSYSSYCPLVLMFHSRNMNNKKYRLHERCLRIVYNDKTSTFENLFVRDRSASVQIRNLPILATEMFKVLRD